MTMPSHPSNLVSSTPSMTNKKNEVIQFHVLPTFVSITNFDTLSNPVRTQAGDDPERLALNVTSSGSQVNLTTAVVNTTVGGSVYSDHQLAIYQVDKFLLPKDFFVPKPPPPAPAPSKAKDSKRKSEDGAASPAGDNSAAAMSLKHKNGMCVDKLPTWYMKYVVLGVQCCWALLISTCYVGFACIEGECSKHFGSTFH